MHIAGSVCKELLLIQMLWNTDHVSRGQMLTECYNGHCSNKTGAVLVPLCPETVWFGHGIVTIKLKPLYLTNTELNWTHFLLDTANMRVHPIAQLPLLPDGASQNCSWGLCSYPALLPLPCYSAVDAVHCQSEGQFGCMSDLSPQPPAENFLLFQSVGLSSVISAFCELYKETFGRSYCSLFSFFSAMKHILSPHSCWDLSV